MTYWQVRHAPGKSCGGWGETRSYSVVRREHEDAKEAKDAKRQKHRPEAASPGCSSSRPSLLRVFAFSIAGNLNNSERKETASARPQPRRTTRFQGTLIRFSSPGCAWNSGFCGAGWDRCQ